jgi:ABC-type microcin C transport system duplicated ATPase subunit YejF
MQNHQIDKNQQIVFSNVTKKYEVEMITFPLAPAKGPRESYPEQSGPQKIMIQVAGKTRPAILIQDEQTSEPTLTDFDNGKPMDDILRK